MLGFALVFTPTPSTSSRDLGLLQVERTVPFGGAGSGPRLGLGHSAAVRAGEGGNRLLWDGSSFPAR